jgi:hypothetical protein
MQIALAATLLLAVVWFVALRPKPSTDGGSGAAPATAAPHTTAAGAGAAPGVAGLKGAIDKAQGAVATASGDAQRAAQSSADGAAPAAAAGSAATGHPASPATSAHGAASSVAAPVGGRAGVRTHAGGAPSAHPRAGGQVGAVQAALRQHKAVAIAFVDPGTADGRSVGQEMGHVSRFGGRALALAVPLSQLSAYDFITNAVQVTVAPTVVIVDRRGRATTIVGFADGGEIEQRLADALATRR